jgi:hypothetical protein
MVVDAPSPPHSPRSAPPSHSASGLEAAAFALETAAFVVAIAWAIAGLVAGVLWLTVLFVAGLAACGWWRPGVAGGVFLAVALLSLPFSVYVYDYSGGDSVGVGIGLAVSLPPVLIGALLIAAGRLTHRARSLRGPETQAG